ncbi:MAG: hypothetical protein R3C20_09130 [Planctomycetaceae bacterium]
MSDRNLIRLQHLSGEANRISIRLTCADSSGSDVEESIVLEFLWPATDRLHGNTTSSSTGKTPDDELIQPTRHLPRANYCFYVFGMPAQKPEKSGILSDID